MDRCKFCKKPLPDVVDVMCPHCFAAWTPDDEEDKSVKNTESQDKE